MSTVPVLVLGKKKMFASSSKGKSSHRLAVASDDLNDLEDFPRDVYGAVVQNINNLESTTDDPGIDILHSLLLDSTSAEEAAAKRYVVMGFLKPLLNLKEGIADRPQLEQDKKWPCIR